MALTIADAFKLAYENHERGKAEKSQGAQRVAQDDNKENTQHAKPVVNKGNIDALYATPVKAKSPQSYAPMIQVTADSSSSTAVEDSCKKLQSLVMCMCLFDFNTILAQTLITDAACCGLLNH